MGLPEILVQLPGKLRSENLYSILAFLLISNATVQGFRMLPDLTLSSLAIFNMILLIDVITLFYVEPRLKEKKKAPTPRTNPTKKEGG